MFETAQAMLPVPVFGEDWHVGDARREDGWDEARWRARPIGRDEPAAAERFESRTYRPSSVLAAAELRALLRAMPAGVLRLKGIVRTDEHGWSELQFAGRHGLLRPALAAPDESGAAIVAIGLRGRLPHGALAAALGAAAVSRG